MEYVPDSPSVARLYCPECEPDADPTCEILDIRWCASHAPSYSGRDDLVISVESFLSGSIEAGGEVNRRWCDLLHRRDSEPAEVAAAPAP